MPTSLFRRDLVDVVHSIRDRLLKIFVLSAGSFG